MAILYISRTLLMAQTLCNCSCSRVIYELLTLRACVFGYTEAAVCSSFGSKRRCLVNIHRPDSTCGKISCPSSRYVVNIYRCLVNNDKSISPTVLLRVHYLLNVDRCLVNITLMDHISSLPHCLEDRHPCQTSSKPAILLAWLGDLIIIRHGCLYMRSLVIEGFVSMETEHTSI